MDLSTRSTLLNSEDYKGKVRAALADWMGHWAMTGTAGIEDETLRDQTERILRMLLMNFPHYSEEVAILAISRPCIRDAVEVSDENITTAVAEIMTGCLAYL